MATINYATKYSQKVDERFALVAKTAPAVNKDYDFVGVKSVHVYSIGVAAMNDYSRTGSSRYGTADDLDITDEELTMKKDRSFTFVIDRGNREDTEMVAEAGAALNRQITEVVAPEIDKYRLAVLAALAGTKSTPAAITKNNAYSAFLDANEALTDANVPEAGRICYCSTAFYKAIKQDDAFVKKGDMAQTITINGVVGEVDGVPIIVMPKSYMPTKTDFIITNPVACTSPMKLQTYKIHEDPPGISGWLVEGRVYYDAFVLGNKKKAVYRHLNAALTEDETTAEAVYANTPVKKAAE